MSKHGFQKFDRRPQDAYDTPSEAVQPLLRALGQPTTFIEPCGGSGALMRALEAAGYICRWAGDIEPRAQGIERRDGADPAVDGTVITNPPYARPEFRRLLDAWLGRGLPCWLLLPFDWLCNQWFVPYAARVHQIAPIGRVRWIVGSEHNSTDNFAWMLVAPQRAALVRLHSRN